MTLKLAVERQPNLPRWICHIRQRLVDRRLSLLTGAGISIDCGAPSWGSLVEALSGELDDFAETFSKHKSAGIQSPLLTQFIYSRYIDEYLNSKKDIPDTYKYLRARNEWYGAIRRVLYKEIPAAPEEVVKIHPYIESLAHLCVKCAGTITFNFDDILDQVATSVTPDYQLPPKTTWQLPPMESNNAPYIYHINGLLPQLERKKASENLIFTEDSFLQLLYGQSPSNNSVLHSFTNNTYLLLGLSLDDHSLKSILTTNATKSPGSIHYIIHWMKDDASLSPKQMDDISRANFEMFNLVTIFLTSAQINEFLVLVQTGVERGGFPSTTAMDEAFANELRRLVHSVPVRYRYYITGPVASGKSTLLENLRSFQTLEEWPERTPPTLYQDHKLLTDSQRTEVDEWVYRQLKIKNVLFSRCAPGIHVMDRAPLDLFAFSKDDAENSRKADDIVQKVEPDENLADGEVILVIAGADHLLERQLRRGRVPTTTPGGMSYDGASLDLQREILQRTYKGAQIYSTDDCNAHQLAKRVVAEILFGDYRPIDISKLNRAIGNGDVVTIAVAAE